MYCRNNVVAKTLWRTKRRILFSCNENIRILLKVFGFEKEDYLPFLTDFDSAMNLLKVSRIIAQNIEIRCGNYSNS